MSTPCFINVQWKTLSFSVCPFCNRVKMGRRPSTWPPFTAGSPDLRLLFRAVSLATCFWRVFFFLLLLQSCSLRSVWTELDFVLTGAEIDSEDKNGNSPLHIAARYGHELLINTLISNGADVAKWVYDCRWPWKDTESDFTWKGFASPEGLSGLVLSLPAHGPTVPWDEVVFKLNEQGKVYLNILLKVYVLIKGEWRREWPDWHKLSVHRLAETGQLKTGGFNSKFNP